MSWEFTINSRSSLAAALAALIELLGFSVVVIPGERWIARYLERAKDFGASAVVVPIWLAHHDIGRDLYKNFGPVIVPSPDGDVNWAVPAQHWEHPDDPELSRLFRLDRENLLRHEYQGRYWQYTIRGWRKALPKSAKIVFPLDMLFIPGDPEYSVAQSAAFIGALLDLQRECGAIRSSE